jgi:hypothetical protein
MDGECINCGESGNWCECGDVTPEFKKAADIEAETPITIGVGRDSSVAQEIVDGLTELAIDLEQVRPIKLKKVGRFSSIEEMIRALASSPEEAEQQIRELYTSGEPRIKDEG